MSLYFGKHVQLPPLQQRRRHLHLATENPMPQEHTLPNALTCGHPYHCQSQRAHLLLSSIRARRSSSACRSYHYSFHAASASTIQNHGSVHGGIGEAASRAGAGVPFRDRPTRPNGFPELYFSRNMMFCALRQQPLGCSEELSLPKTSVSMRFILSKAAGPTLKCTVVDRLARFVKRFTRENKRFLVAVH